MKLLPKSISKIFLLMLINVSVCAETEQGVKSIFQHGQTLYEQGDFENAITEISKAIRLSPENSHYHHWLAKSYGELAEESGWIKAINLAKKSRESLKTAVKLDPENIAALTDMMRYYKEAPGFLGGSEEKAKEIAAQLEELKKKQGNLPNTHENNTSKIESDITSAEKKDTQNSSPLSNGDRKNKI